MNSKRSQCNNIDPGLLYATGATHWSIIEATEVDPEATELYDRWIADGCHGTMDYLERHADLRRDPRLLLEGAQSIICFAFPYFTPNAEEPAMRIARYAPGRDYHKVVRRRLKPLADEIDRAFGAVSRVCVDSAPLRERYWAARSGLGFIGRNNTLIIPGCGSYFFLGFILTTARLTPTPVSAHPGCGTCTRCVDACPTGALSADGRCDASRCLSYLTIEHRGDLPPSTDLHATFYGCDRCAEACPHNHSPEPTEIADFTPRPEILRLTPRQAAEMTEDDFDRLFNGTAMRRAGILAMKRNANIILRNSNRN